MKAIRNTTYRPLKIRLSRGKVLHLGPGKEGQIVTNDAELPSVKTLLADGSIEIVGEETLVPGQAPTQSSGQADTRAQHPNKTVKKRGER